MGSPGPRDGETRYPGQADYPEYIRGVVAAGKRVGLEVNDDVLASITRVNRRGRGDATEWRAGLATLGTLLTLKQLREALRQQPGQAAAPAAAGAAEAAAPAAAGDGHGRRGAAGSRLQPQPLLHNTLSDDEEQLPGTRGAASGADAQPSLVARSTPPTVAPGGNLLPAGGTWLPEDQPQDALTGRSGGYGAAGPRGSGLLQRTGRDDAATAAAALPCAAPAAAAMGSMGLMSGTDVQEAVRQLFATQADENFSSALAAKAANAHLLEDAAAAGPGRGAAAAAAAGRGSGGGRGRDMSDNEEVLPGTDDEPLSQLNGSTPTGGNEPLHGADLRRQVARLVRVRRRTHHPASSAASPDCLIEDLLGVHTAGGYRYSDDFVQDYEDDIQAAAAAAYAAAGAAAAAAGAVGGAGGGPGAGAAAAAAADVRGETGGYVHTGGLYETGGMPLDLAGLGSSALQAKKSSMGAAAASDRRGGSSSIARPWGRFAGPRGAAAAAGAVPDAADGEKGGLGNSRFVSERGLAPRGYAQAPPSDSSTPPTGGDVLLSVNDDALVARLLGVRGHGGSAGQGSPGPVFEDLLGVHTAGGYRYSDDFAQDYEDDVQAAAAAAYAAAGTAAAAVGAVGGAGGGPGAGAAAAAAADMRGETGRYVHIALAEAFAAVAAAADGPDDSVALPERNVLRGGRISLGPESVRDLLRVHAGQRLPLTMSLFVEEPRLPHPHPAGFRHSTVTITDCIFEEAEAPGVYRLRVEGGALDRHEGWVVLDARPRLQPSRWAAQVLVCPPALVAAAVASCCTAEAAAAAAAAGGGSQPTSSASPTTSSEWSGGQLPAQRRSGVKARRAAAATRPAAAAAATPAAAAAATPAPAKRRTPVPKQGARVPLGRGAAAAAAAAGAAAGAAAAPAKRRRTMQDAGQRHGATQQAVAAAPAPAAAAAAAAAPSPPAASRSTAHQLQQQLLDLVGQLAPQLAPLEGLAQIAGVQQALAAWQEVAEDDARLAVLVRKTASLAQQIKDRQPVQQLLDELATLLRVAHVLIKVGPCRPPYA